MLNIQNLKFPIAAGSERVICDAAVCTEVGV